MINNKSNGNSNIIPVPFDPSLSGSQGRRIAFDVARAYATHVINNNNSIMIMIMIMIMSLLSLSSLLLSLS